MLRGKVAIVTASTDGIGLAIARKLAQEGAKVVISSRKQENVDRALQQLRNENLPVSGIVCHVGKTEHRKALVAKAIADYGGVDILVSNAAVNPYFGPFIQTPEDAFDKTIDINVKAAFMLIKETVPFMEERGKGSIILVSSIGGYTPNPLLGVYSVTKTALLGMTKALSTELSASQIRVNAIAPGIIKTRFSDMLWKSPSVAEEAKTSIPMRRLGEPEDCAGIVSFLASDEASYITGETIVIAGGSKSRL